MAKNRKNKKLLKSLSNIGMTFEEWDEACRRYEESLKEPLDDPSYNLPDDDE